VGVSKPRYNMLIFLYLRYQRHTVTDVLYLLSRLAFLYVIFWFIYSHVWLSFMLYFGLLTPTFGFPLCYILVYLLPRLANVEVSQPKYNIKENQTWE
jgi:hypothetical protein